MIIYLCFFIDKSAEIWIAYYSFSRKLQNSTDLTATISRLKSQIWTRNREEGILSNKYSTYVRRHKALAVQQMNTLTIKVDIRYFSHPPLGNKCCVLKATGRDYVTSGCSVPEDVIVISHFCLLFIVFVPDGISLLCSADEESPYLLFGLKEGQDRLILITSNGGFGLWFQDWKMSNVFHFSCPS